MKFAASYNLKNERSLTQKVFAWKPIILKHIKVDGKSHKYVVKYDDVDGGEVIYSNWIYSTA